MAKLVEELQREGIPLSDIGIAFSSSDNAPLLPQELLDSKESIRQHLIHESQIPTDIKIFISSSQNKHRCIDQQAKQQITLNIPRFVAALGNPCVARQGHERHYEGLVPPDGENIPNHTQPGRAGHPPCHRSGLGQRRPGYAAKIFRLYRQQYQGKTHQF